MDVLDTLVREMRDGMFTGSASARTAVDAPLWFFWTLQQLERELGGKAVWERYGEAMKGILENYRRGIDGRVVMNENGLVWASANGGFPVSWMDSVIGGEAVTPRDGYQVEVQALWYNAVCYALELAAAAGDKAFVKQWQGVPERTKKAFNDLFVLREGYLADYVGAEGANDFIRPNMVVACGLKYKMIPSETIVDTLRTIRQHLLTPRGLRTLSPRNPLYRGSQEGTPAERDFAGKNGSVWPWLLPFYVSACFDVNGDRFLPSAEQILEDFEEDIQSYGIGSICELYDADPPYASRGAISHAWSVAAVLEIYRMIRERQEPAPKRGRKAASEGADGSKGSDAKAAKASASAAKAAAKAAKAEEKAAGKRAAKAAKTAKKK